MDVNYWNNNGLLLPSIWNFILTSQYLIWYVAALQLSNIVPIVLSVSLVIAVSSHLTSVSPVWLWLMWWEDWDWVWARAK